MLTGTPEDPSPLCTPFSPASPTEPRPASWFHQHKMGQVGDRGLRTRAGDTRCVCSSKNQCGGHMSQGEVPEHGRGLPCRSSRYQKEQWQTGECRRCVSESRETDVPPGLGGWGLLLHFSLPVSSPATLAFCTPPAPRPSHLGGLAHHLPPGMPFPPALPPPAPAQPGGGFLWGPAWPHSLSQLWNPECSLPAPHEQACFPAPWRRGAPRTRCRDTACSQLHPGTYNRAPGRLLNE